MILRLARQKAKPHDPASPPRYSRKCPRSLREPRPVPTSRFRAGIWGDMNGPTAAKGHMPFQHRDCSQWTAAFASVEHLAATGDSVHIETDEMHRYHVPPARNPNAIPKPAKQPSGRAAFGYEGTF